MKRRAFKREYIARSLRLVNLKKSSIVAQADFRLVRIEMVRRQARHGLYIRGVEG